MRGCKAFVALVGMMGIMAASSISACAAPVIETNPIKFVQYKCTNMNVEPVVSGELDFHGGRL